MSNLGEKLHTLISHLRGGIDVSRETVDSAVTELSTHIGEAVLPAVEAKVKGVLDSLETDIKKAVSDALAVEREMAQKLTDELNVAYEKLVAEFGIDAANQAAAAAHATAQAAVADPAAETPSA